MWSFFWDTVYIVTVVWLEQSHVIGYDWSLLFSCYNHCVLCIQCACIIVLTTSLIWLSSRVIKVDVSLYITWIMCICPFLFTGRSMSPSHMYYPVRFRHIMVIDALKSWFTCLYLFSSNSLHAQKNDRHDKCYRTFKVQRHAHCVFDI